MDVVPVYPDEWKYPPFAAHMDEKGDIYARGSQDCKCISIQHLEAIRRLKLNGIRLKRTIHISFVPDEETGGKNGMGAFVETQDFKNLNIGFALDESLPSGSDDTHVILYGEKCLCRIWIHCPGNCGHGSLLLENTAGEKLNVIIDRFMKFRESEKVKLKDPKVQYGDITSVNLTVIKGGVQLNVIPKELSVGFDIRIAPDVNHEKFENMIKGWCEEAGKGVYYTYENKDPFIENSKLDKSNIFWIAFKKACDDSKVKLNPIICPGTTDARYLRAIGIPAFGFSPLFDTPILAHDHNEFLNKDIFLKGIQEFIKIIPAVANV
ncbi:aminoacylase-1-like isoform X2 [Belonocnema kinseyi]|nr:aminoacylase-1-like isoform X2 [Belonocnema kinseyi]XP_033221954.1 aminoacylase-1-like isoform X2 [Belonocnema kinseyi]